VADYGLTERRGRYFALLCHN